MQTAKPIDMDQAARISLRLYHPVKERPDNNTATA
jgi:hypothetical protein